MALAGTLHVAVRDDAVRHLLAGTSVDLQGLPGSGRTALADAVAAELEDSGWTAVRVHGVLPLRDRPLEALAVAGLVARQGGAQQGPTTAVAAAVQGVLTAVRGATTVLVVDDADDLDDASVGALVAAHARAPFVVLSTSRPAPPSLHPAGRLTALVQPGVTLEVGPLGFVDLQTLLVETLGGPLDQGAVARVFAGSGGLAGLALALAHGARLHGAMREVDGVWRAGPELWSPELARAVEPLLHRLGAAATDGLQALALAGTVELTTARRFVSWDVLEELDGYRLLRFVARGDETLVGAFPPAIVEHYRHLVGARHLRVDETVASAFGALAPQRPAGVATAYRLLGADDAPAEQPGTAGPALDDVVFNRLLLEHWHRELLLRRDEWEQSPTPRTAAALLRTMLVAGSDAREMLAVRDATPRTGDRRALTEFDDWYALFLGAVEHDLEGVRAVLDRTRAEAEEWAPLVDGIEAFLLLLVDHAPDPDELEPGPPEDTRQIVSTARTELLLAQGRSAEALAELGRLGEPTSAFARARGSAPAWALLLEDRVDESLALAGEVLATARREYDVENIVGAAYVVANVLLMRGRRAELRSLLGSVLSSGLLAALDRPQHVALLSMAADIAADDGRATTSRTLVQQALALQTGPGPYPLGSPTTAIARLDGAGMPPAKARALHAERLWAEATVLLERGYTFSGYVCGMLAVVAEPTPERGAVLAEVGARMPAPLVRRYELFVHALADGDPELLVSTGHDLAGTGLVWAATECYRSALSALRAGGALARAADVHEDARRRLAAWGPEAAGGLRSAADVAELTAREHEIARLAAAGLANQEIAHRLVISVRTVENHLNRAFRKLGVESRGDLPRVLSG